MRAFVVGNGPSLNYTDLDLLCDEVTFATNNIDLIYPRTSWRPKFYVRAEQSSNLDPEAWLDSKRVHVKSEEVIFCNTWYTKWMERAGEPVLRHVNIIGPCAHYAVNFDSPNSPHLWHLPRLCSFGSSLNVAIQLAVMSGSGPIYLVGCDLGYTDDGPSHFDPSYEKGGEQPARIANLNMLAAHMAAKRSSPVPIYNATIGGQLEVCDAGERRALERHLQAGRRGVSQLRYTADKDGQTMLASATKRAYGQPRFVMPILASMIESDNGISYLVRHEVLHEGFERVSRDIIDAHLEPGDTFIDLGAHWGVITLSAITRHPGRIKAIAVEPHPPNVQQLMRAVAANRAGELVEIVPAAAGSMSQSTVQYRQLLRPFPQFSGGIYMNPGWGNSNYHALETRLGHREEGRGVRRGGRGVLLRAR